MSKEINSSNEFPKKYAKQLDQTFVDAVDQMNTNDIKARIITVEGHLLEIETAKASDTKLVSAKEEAKKLSSPYRDTQKAEIAKLKYCLYVLENRGVELK